MLQELSEKMANLIIKYFYCITLSVVCLINGTNTHSLHSDALAEIIYSVSSCPLLFYEVDSPTIKVLALVE